MNKQDNIFELVLTFNLLHVCGILTKKLRVLFFIFWLYLLKKTLKNLKKTMKQTYENLEKGN